MNQKYMQILDTDYKNYMVVYTCQDSAEFTDSSGNELSYEAVFKAGVN